jgi:Ca2+-transporting ATPase
LNAQIVKMSEQGYRVLGIAIGLDGGNMKHIDEKNAAEFLSVENAANYDKMESGLSFVGYVCIQDPVRPECKAAIQQCRTAGINVIMITGDSKETAVAIAKQLHIITDG